MMNDARDFTTPPVEVGNNGKVIAAVAVALGFVAMGAFGYEVRHVEFITQAHCSRQFRYRAGASTVGECRPKRVAAFADNGPSAFAGEIC